MRLITAPYSFAGVDISEHQSGLDIRGYIGEFPLVVIKVTEGGSFVDSEFRHFAEETTLTPYRGFYHYSTHANPALQAENFLTNLRRASLLPLRPGNFLVIDSEKSAGVEVLDEVTAEIQRIVDAATDRPTWRYGYRSMARRWRNNGYAGPLWLASFDVISDSFALNAVLDQYGVAEALPPFYGGQIDVNRVIDLDLLHSLTHPQPEEADMGPISYHPDGDTSLPAAVDSPENALGWTVDNAAQAKRFASAASSKADAILAALAAAAPAVDLQTVSDELLLAEVARRFKI